MNAHLPLRASLLTVSLLGLAACSTVNLDESGDMRATYVAGQFRMLVNANAASAAKATSEAFQQLGLFQIQNELRTYDADLAARTALDEKVRVNIREVNSRQTELRIRVDIVGDKNYSRKLYEQIERNLQSGGATAAGGAWSTGW